MELLAKEDVAFISRLKHYVRIGRPSTGVRPVLFFLLGSAFSNASFEWNLNLIFPSLSLIFLVMAVNIYNDIMDFKIDKISNSKRLLVSGKITFPQAISLVKIYLLISLVFMMLTGWIGVFFWCLLCILGMGYSFAKTRISHNMTLAPIVLIICNIFLPLALGSSLIAGQILIKSPALQLSLWFIWIYIGIGSYKDFKDILGDNKVHKKTIPLKIGVARTIIFNTLVSTTALVFFINWLRTNNLLNFVTLICAIYIIVLQLFLYLVKHQQKLLCGLIRTIWTAVNLLTLSLLR